MRVLVIGAEGQLGAGLCEAYADRDLYRADLDGPGFHLNIGDVAAVRRVLLDEVRPQLVINTAAAHNVPRCEQEPETAFRTNAIGPWHLANACRELGARLVHVSTDYVFDGSGERPYLETDPPAPLNVYGASKLAGERLVAAYCPGHIIVRPAALYGPAPCRAKDGRNFVSLMLHLAATQPEVRVVTDEITTPTYTVALARQIRLLAERGEPGLYHATCTGQCSWYEFAAAIFEDTGTPARLVPARAAEFHSAVRRPAYSVLENANAARQGLDIMPPWRDALRDYLTSLA